VEFGLYKATHFR